MPVALSRVYLYTHHGDGVFNTIQKVVQVRSEVRSDHVLVVPIPNHVTGARFYGFRADVSRHTEFWHVLV